MAQPIRTNQRKRNARLKTAPTRSQASDNRSEIKPSKKDELQELKAKTPTGSTVHLLMVVSVLTFVVFVWSYWPTWMNLVSQWNQVPDYSHGFLVAPLAGLFLWIRRDQFPGITFGASNMLGLLIIAFAGVIRSISSYYYLDALDGWSIPIWISGFVLMFCGWRVFWWAMPSMVFLIFMVPLPYTIETMMAQPLQVVSTNMSSFVLQCLGQPAITEGSTILLGDQTLEIVRACSGLRILFGVAALAFAFIVLFERPFWAKILMIAGVLPIALLANSIRIVMTGLLYQVGFDEAANRISHDVAGWVMIPLAAAFFGALLFYLDRLFRRMESVDTAGMVRAQTRRR